MDDDFAFLYEPFQQHHHHQHQPKVIYDFDGQPRYHCPQCGVKYKKIGALRSHMRECGKGAQCPFCPKVVTQRRNLASHMERHRREGLFFNEVEMNPTEWVQDQPRKFNRRTMI